MATLHYISYSHVDGLDFANVLHDELVGSYPPFHVWLDKYALKAGESWAPKIEQALRDADIVLYVITSDSTDPLSMPFAEVTQAIKHGKQVILLVADPKAEPPLGMQRHTIIDFTKDFRLGMALLRKHLRQPDELDLGVQARPDYWPNPATKREVRSSPRPDLASKRVFISYAHKDKKWLDRLRVHLKPLEYDGLLTVWEDTKISPGALWESEIAHALDSARVAVLLISADFLASRFIMNQELPKLLARAESNGTVIMPLIISASQFAHMPILSRFQAVNPPSRPIAKLPRPRREDYFNQLAEAVGEAIASS